VPYVTRMLFIGARMLFVDAPCVTDLMAYLATGSGYGLTLFHLLLITILQQ